MVLKFNIILLMLESSIICKCYLRTVDQENSLTQYTKITWSVMIHVHICLNMFD